MKWRKRRGKRIATNICTAERLHHWNNDLMPIPKLITDYLPSGIYDCSFQELKESFDFNSRRADLVDKLEKYIGCELQLYNPKPTPHRTQIAYPIR